MTETPQTPDLTITLSPGDAARNILGLKDAITMDVAFPNRTLDDDPIEASRWEFNPQRIATLTGASLPENAQRKPRQAETCD
ncbi:MAG: hypothetical protein GY770_20790 [Aestuariibacter sp.]|nr:hypothetical protein [Aestuariibacter sp.]